MEAVRDNAGLMLIKFLIDQGAKKIYIAGMDGYSHDIESNFGDDKLTYITRTAVFDEMNAGMTAVLKEYSKEISIVFLTKPKYIGVI